MRQVMFLVLGLTLILDVSAPAQSPGARGVFSGFSPAPLWPENQDTSAYPSQHVFFRPSHSEYIVSYVDDDDEVQQKLPSLWVEVLSPDDRLNRVQKKLQELLDFGVPTVWLIDPYEHRAWTGTRVTGLIPVEDNVLRCESLKLELNLEEVISS